MGGPDSSTTSPNVSAKCLRPGDGMDCLASVGAEEPMLSTTSSSQQQAQALGRDGTVLFAVEGLFGRTTSYKKQAYCSYCCLLCGLTRASRCSASPRLSVHAYTVAGHPQERHIHVHSNHAEAPEHRSPGKRELQQLPPRPNPPQYRQLVSGSPLRRVYRES